MPQQAAEVMFCGKEMISTWGQRQRSRTACALCPSPHVHDRPALAATQPSPAHRLAINSDAAERL